jgi:hypothetical protein
MSKGSVAATLVLAAAAFLAMPASSQTSAPKTAASLPAAATPPIGVTSGEQLKLKGPVTDYQRGTIATITDLAQQLKIEQLKRDLREARQTASPSPAADAAIAKVNALAVPAAGSPRVPVTAAQERQPPVVAAIFGMGSRLRVRLQDGRELVSGQEAQGWIINAVTPAGLSSRTARSRRRGQQKVSVSRSWCRPAASRSRPMAWLDKFRSGRADAAGGAVPDDQPVTLLRTRRADRRRCHVFDQRDRTIVLGRRQQEH